MKMKEMKLFSRFTLILLFLFSSICAIQAQSVGGTVVDAKGEPMIGVTVSVSKTKGTITDFDGNYKLDGITPNDVLNFSYVGYEPQNITIGNQTTINVTLIESAALLDEVVVVGYGTMKKKDLTGAIGMVNAEKLEREQPNTVQDLLRVGVPGMSMGISTDAKGNAGNIVIRGKNSFSASTDPLLVLDGVIYYGDLTDINPNDIERLDVLKDASSTSVFGAKAANGVILITTKKGKSEKPTIRFGTTLGLAFRNIPDTYKGKDYVNFRQAVMQAQNPSRSSSYYEYPGNFNNTDLNEWYGTDSGDMTNVWLTRLGLSNNEIANYIAGNVVDWEDLTYKTAFNQDYTVSVSGAKNDTKYYTSLNYLKNENNVRGGGYSAVRARVNLESKVLGVLTYGVNAQFTSRDESYTSVGSTGYRIASPYGDVYDEAGKLTLFVNGNNNQKNPLIDAYYTNKEYDINNLNASVYLNLKLPYGFSIQSTYSPRFQWTNERTHKSTEHPQWNTADSETAKRRNTKQMYWQVDNTLKWNKTYGKHAFDFTFLWNLEKLQTWSDQMIAKGLLPDDALGSHGVQWGTTSEITSTDNYSTGDALMGRLHYVFDDRYLVTGTVRRDGYSAFGQNNPRATFPSLALGWVFTEESFFPKNNWLDYAKLRLSWGKNGNRDIGMYEALMLLEARKYYSVNYSTGELFNLNTYYASKMANKDLKWESTSAFNVGLDFNMFKNRLSGSIDFYQKRTNDLLVARALPDVTGYTSVMSNIGQVQNTGLEFALNSVNIDQKDFTWNTNLTFYTNKNKINKLYGLMEDVLDADGKVIGQRESDDITNGRFIGQSIDEIWDYKILGVWQENEVEEAEKYGQSPGDFKILDVDGNMKYGNDDKVFQGSKVPKVIMSMRNSFTFLQNFTFSFSLYTQLGFYKKFNEAKNDGALLNTTNQIKSGYWTPENRSTEYARLSSKAPDGISYNVWRRANFIRLDNVSLGYQFPKKLVKNLKLESLNINVTATNLKYWTEWPGGDDPELNDNKSSSDRNKNNPTRLVFGLNVTF